MGNKFLKNKEQDMRHVLLDLLNTNSYGSTVGLVENILAGNQPTSLRETRHSWALDYSKGRSWGSESPLKFLLN